MKNCLKLSLKMMAIVWAFWLVGGFIVLFINLRSGGDFPTELFKCWFASIVASLGASILVAAYLAVSWIVKKIQIIKKATA